MRITLHDLPTPALVLDLARLTTNAGRMMARAQAAGVALRPHVKTHKCIEIGRIQSGGRPGPITVSTLAEARAFAAGGFSDILYAVPIEPGKIGDAARLAGAVEAFTVITDDLDVVGRLNRAAAAGGVTIGTAVEIDCGYHRSGVDPEDGRAADIAGAIAASSNLRAGGILTHAGHAYDAKNAAEAAAIARAESGVMRALAARLRAAGIPVPCVSVGSTPTVCSGAALDGIDEIRPGNYALFDAHQAAIGSCTVDDCAATVLAAVTHRSLAGGRATIDAGAIALSKDPGPRHVDPRCGFGEVLDLDARPLGIRVAALSQEHGHLQADPGLLERLPVGARVRVVPNHSCLTVAQFPWFDVLDGDAIVDRWEIHRGW